MKEVGKDRDPKGPRTKFEEFTASDGVLRLTEFFDLEDVRTLYGHLAAVLIRSFNAQSMNSSIALRFDFKDQEGYEAVALLDEDEVAAVDRALTLIAERRTKLESKANTYTELNFFTRSGFKIGIYFGKGKPGDFAYIGNQSIFFHSLRDLHRAIEAALFKIDILNNGAVDEPQKLLEAR